MKYRSRNLFTTTSDTAGYRATQAACEKTIVKIFLNVFCCDYTVSKPWLFHLVILAWVSWSCRILAHVGLLKRHPVARVRRRRCRALWPGAVVLHGLARIRTCCSHSGAILLAWESLWEETVTWRRINTDKIYSIMLLEDRIEKIVLWHKAVSGTKVLTRSVFVSFQIYCDLDHLFPKSDNRMVGRRL